MPSCLVCHESIESFIEFGRMPLGNGFLEEKDFASEMFFNLGTSFCPNCTMVQLTELVDREKMFRADYPFFSSSSRRMKKHFELYALHAIDLVSGERDPLVIEIGSNDGVLLRHFAERGIRHVGFEPSTNVADAARALGVNTRSCFFDQASAEELIDESGQADLILAANVMCHLPYIHSVAAGVQRLLKPGGRFIFEDPYLGDIIEKNSFDQIYDEHAFYFSVHSVSRAFREHGLEVIDAIPQKVHGGSMRYVLAHQGRYDRSSSIDALRNHESTLALDRPETYRRFRSRVETIRDQLRSLLTGIRDSGKRIVGYAATSKSTTVINYCGIGTDLVDYISDTTPLKQGRFSPGAHLPIRPHREFVEKPPDFALLFGWNHADEIFENERRFVENGGRWILYVPSVRILSD